MPRPKENLIGKKFGKWTVLDKYRIVNPGKKNVIKWICQCECGNTSNIVGTQLKSGHSTQCKYCAGKYFKDIKGQRFGKWQVIDKSNSYPDRWICRCDCGNEKHLRGNWLRTGHSTKCKKCASTEYSPILIGTKINKLTVISDPKINKNKKYQTCICECGDEVEVRLDYLKLGNIKGCISCSHRKGGYEEISQQFWTSIVNGASNRDLEFEITIEYAWTLFLEQDRKCALTDVNLYFDPHGGKKFFNNNASLDRIDSSLGYIEGNVQWVCKHINRMKQAMREDIFIDFCTLVSQKAQRKIDPEKFITPYSLKG